MTLIDGTWEHPSTALIKLDVPDFHERSFAYRYWISFYTAALFLLGNDLYARTTLERIVGTILNLGGSFIQGQLFAELTNLVYRMMEKQIKLQETFDVANGTMVRLFVPMET